MSRGQIKMWMLRKMIAGMLRTDRDRNPANQLLALGVAAGAGAGLMYLLDPERGRRRRAVLRDAAVRSASDIGCAVTTSSRDLTNRVKGLAAITSAAFTHDEADDEVIRARVRARLGRVVSHPGAIEVGVHNGRVTLAGAVLASEADELQSAVSAVRGVTEVSSRLQVHPHAGDVPSLQGGRKRQSEGSALWHRQWSPAMRLVSTLTGGALMGVCLRRRDGVGAALGTAGFFLTLRATTNLEMKRLLGVGGGCRAFDVCKTVNINAPVEQVFEYWTNYENFPHFMHNVRAVRDLGNSRSRWTVAGPAGVPVEWNAVITDYEPGHLLAWKSEPGSIIRNAGLIHFESNGDQQTRVTIRMSYNPPAGAFGHAFARLFGADPKHEIDQDMIRLKTMIETGHPPHDAAQPITEAAFSARGMQQR